MAPVLSPPRPAPGRARHRSPERECGELLRLGADLPSAHRRLTRGLSTGYTNSAHANGTCIQNLTILPGGSGLRKRSGFRLSRLSFHSSEQEGNLRKSVVTHVESQRAGVDSSSI